MTRDRRLVRLPDGRRLCYAELGDPAGFPILLFHGFPGSRFQRPSDIGPLQRRDLRLISFDRPGIGGSDPAPRSLRGGAEDVRVLADSLGLDRFVAIGVSGGGPYAMATAIAMPDRVEKLVLVGSLAPVAPWPGPVASIYPATLWLRCCVMLPFAPRACLALANALGRVGGFPPPSPWFTRLLLPRSDADALCSPSFAPTIRADLMTAFEQGIEGTFADTRTLGLPWGFDPSEVRVPTYLFHGVRDRIVPPEMGRYLARRIPGCRAWFPRRLGHYDLPIRHIDQILGRVFAKRA